MGDRDRLAVRPREHGHGGHRQREVARHRRPAAADPDRRGHQPGQLRRPADQHARRGRRHQLADLQPLGRLHGHLVRDPDRRGDAGLGAAACRRPRHPRPHRRRHRPGHARGRRVDRPRQADRCAGASRWKPAVRRRRPASKPATSSPRSTVARSRARSSCRASSAASSRAPRRRCRSFDAAATRDINVVVAELEPERVVARKTPDKDSAKPAAPVSSARAGRLRSDRRAEARAEGRRTA